MNNSKKKIVNELPDFSRMSDDEIANFWDTHDSADYWNQMKPVSEPLVFATSPKKSISIRLPEAMTIKLKQIAREKGIGYQPLIRMWLLERLTDESKKTR